MTKSIAQSLTKQRDLYIRKIQRDIRRKFPRADFNILRGPGLKQATIRVAVPAKDPFDAVDAIGDDWINAIEKGFYFDIRPSTLEN